MSGPCRETEAGALIYVRVTPNAGRDEIRGVWEGPNDEMRLTLRVAAPADKGRANKSALALLASGLGAPKSSFSIVAGETGRLKTIAATGDPSTLCEKIKALAAAK